ncbi:hypothetical protein GCM10018779_44350 [Streptomyces griseocarneus]|nr:hypothetical protein GCM10018779_44350 [Streptomyces griseocarneus]
MIYGTPARACVRNPDPVCAGGGCEWQHGYVSDAREAAGPQKISTRTRASRAEKRSMERA